MKNIISFLVCGFVASSAVAQSQNQGCQNTELRGPYEMVLKKQRYATNMLRYTKEMLPSLKDNANSAALVNDTSRTLFFTSLALLGSAGLTLNYALGVSGARYMGYSGWLTRYYMKMGWHPALAPYITKAVPELAMWPGLATMLSGATMISTESTMGGQGSIRNYVEKLKYKPSPAETLRMTLALSPADVESIVNEFVKKMIVETEAELNAKSEKLISEFRDNGNGLFGGNGADYTQALASTQQAKADLYQFHLYLLADVEHDLSRVCSNMAKK